MEQSAQIAKIRDALKKAKSDSSEKDERLRMGRDFARNSMASLKEFCREAREALYHASVNNDLHLDYEPDDTAEVPLSENRDVIVPINDIKLVFNKKYQIPLRPTFIFGNDANMVINLNLPKQHYPRWQFCIPPSSNQWVVHDRNNPNDDKLLSASWILHFISLCITDE